MFKRILVPIDGSALSHDALFETIALLIDDHFAEITLLHVGPRPVATRRARRGPARPVAVGATLGPVSPSVLPAAPPLYAETKDQAVEREEHELQEWLEHAGRPLRERTGATVATTVRIGDPAAEIITEAGRGYDLIAMTVTRRSALRRALHRSVAAAVVRSGIAPVLVVPSD